MAEVTHSLQLLTLENLQVSLCTLARVITGDNNAFDFLLVSQGGICAVPEMLYCTWINSIKWRFKAKQKDKLILFPKVGFARLAGYGTWRQEAWLRSVLQVSLIHIAWSPAGGCPVKCRMRQMDRFSPALAGKIHQ